MSTGHFGRTVPVTLRRFPSLHAKDLLGEKLLFPTDLPSAPFHVATINFKNKHVWNARTWAGLHSSLELLQQHRGDHIGHIYHLFVFPSLYKLWSPIWKYRCKSWALENKIPLQHVLVVYGDRDAICNDIGILNDGRQFAFLIRNSGKVLYASDGRYLSLKHDFAIHKAIRSIYGEKTDAKSIEADQTERIHSNSLL